MQVDHLIPPFAHAVRVFGLDLDMAQLFLDVAARDVANASSYPMPDCSGHLPDDLRGAIVDQAVMLYHSAAGWRADHHMTPWARTVARKYARACGPNA